MITNRETYKKILPAPIDSTEDARNPPTIFATKEDNSHTPISTEANLGGDSFVTTDKPTGERHNSPSVCTR
jgi:hypothetical protein